MSKRSHSPSKDVKSEPAAANPPEKKLKTSSASAAAAPPPARRTIPHNAVTCPVHAGHTVSPNDFAVKPTVRDELLQNANEKDSFSEHIWPVLTPDKGWCVFSRICSRHIGHRLGVYTGKLVAEGTTGEYVFASDAGYVDAKRAPTKAGGPPAHWSGLMNHSSDRPNCKVQKNGVIVQIRQIHRGDELTWNYGSGFKFQGKKVASKSLSDEEMAKLSAAS